MVGVWETRVQFLGFRLPSVSSVIFSFCSGSLFRFGAFLYSVPCLFVGLTVDVVTSSSGMRSSLFVFILLFFSLASTSARAPGSGFRHAQAAVEGRCVSAKTRNPIDVVEIPVLRVFVFSCVAGERSIPNL